MRDGASVQSPGYLPELKQRLDGIKVAQDLQTIRNQGLEKTSISVLVEEYRCQDHAVLSSSVAQATRQTWKIRAVGTRDHANFSGLACWMAPPISVEVETDRGNAQGAETGTQVRIRFDDVQVFPESGSEGEQGNESSSKGPLSDDFTHEWKFLGLASGIGRLNSAERWLPNDTYFNISRVGTAAAKATYEVEVDGSRHPAVVSQQRDDGLFEVEVFERDEGGAMQQTHYPSLGRAHIYHSGTDTNIQMPECSVAFTVPKGKPQNVLLTEGGLPFSSLLGRTSPKETRDTNDFASERRITMDVPRKSGLTRTFASIIGFAEMEEIAVNASPAKLNHFLSGEVRRGDCGSDELSKWWTLQLGPFAEHIVQIKRLNQDSPLHTLIVDDQVLLECTGQDIGGTQDVWQCNFRFIGERQIDFNVFEETRDGVERNSKNIVVTPFSYEHVICILHRTDDDFSKIELTVDKVPVEELPMKDDADTEPNLSITRHALTGRYGLKIPEKIVGAAPEIDAGEVDWLVWEDWEGMEGQDSDWDSLTDMKMKEGQDSDEEDHSASEPREGHEWDAQSDPKVREGYDCDWEVLDDDSGYNTEFVGDSAATPDTASVDKANNNSNWTWDGRKSPEKGDDEWSRATSTEAEELVAELEENRLLLKKRAEEHQTTLDDALARGDAAAAAIASQDLERIGELARQSETLWNSLGVADSQRGGHPDSNPQSGSEQEESEKSLKTTSQGKEEQHSVCPSSKLAAGTCDVAQVEPSRTLEEDIPPMPRDAEFLDGQAVALPAQGGESGKDDNSSNLELKVSAGISEPAVPLSAEGAEMGHAQSDPTSSADKTLSSSASKGKAPEPAMSAGGKGKESDNVKGGKGSRTGKGAPLPPSKGKGKGKLQKRKSLLGRKFHWQGLSKERLSGTVFDLEPTETTCQEHELNFDVLQSLFQADDGGAEDAKKKEEKQKAPTEGQVVVFTNARAQHVAIVFRRVFGPTPSVADLEAFTAAVESLTVPLANGKRLEAEDLELMATSFPTKEEAEGLRAAPVERLRRFERLALPLIQVEHAEQRLRALRLKVQAASLQGLPMARCHKLTLASQALRNSSRLRQLLVTIARLGSWINSADLDTHKGFALTSALGKLSSFRALRGDRGLSLLHVVALTTVGGEPSEVGVLDARLNVELEGLSEAARQELPDLRQQVSDFREEASWLAVEAERTEYNEGIRAQLRLILEEEYTDRAVELERALEVALEELKSTLTFFAERWESSDRRAFEAAAMHLLRTVDDFRISLHNAAQQIMEQPQRFRKIYAAVPTEEQPAACNEEVQAVAGSNMAASSSTSDVHDAHMPPRRRISRRDHCSSVSSVTGVRTRSATWQGIQNQQVESKQNGESET